MSQHLREEERQHLNQRSEDIFARNVAAGWWQNIKTGESTIGTRNRPEVMMLMVSELSEASEGYAGSLMDDKLPHRSMAEVELADFIIRGHDLLGAEGFVLAEVDFYGPPANFAKLTFDECLMTLVNLVSSAMEGYRKSNTERYRNNIVSAVVAAYAVGNSFNYDIEGALNEKLNFNATREDHKISSRLAEGGKQF